MPRSEIPTPVCRRSAKPGVLSEHVLQRTLFVFLHHRSALQRGELLQDLALLLGDFPRHFDVDRHEEIALALLLQALDALLAQAERGADLRALRDVVFDLSRPL